MTTALYRRLVALERETADCRQSADIPLADFLAGRLPRGWSLHKAIRASYGYDPEGAEPIGAQRQTIWQGARA
jgi:hypothetical protein